MDQQWCIIYAGEGCVGEQPYFCRLWAHTGRSSLYRAASLHSEVTPRKPPKHAAHAVEVAALGRFDLSFD